jgi:hypothetical protein
LVLKRGVELAIELKQHLLDTCYLSRSGAGNCGLNAHYGKLAASARGRGEGARIISLMDWDGSAR